MGKGRTRTPYSAQSESLNFQVPPVFLLKKKFLIWFQIKPKIPRKTKAGSVTEEKGMGQDNGDGYEYA